MTGAITNRCLTIRGTKGVRTPLARVADHIPMTVIGSSSGSSKSASVSGNWL